MWVFVLDLFVSPFGCGSEYTEPGAKEWIEFGPTSTGFFLGFIWDLGLLEPLGPHGSELVPEERGDEGVEVFSCRSRCSRRCGSYIFC